MNTPMVMSGLLFLALAVPPVKAEGLEGKSERLLVGSTKIFCFVEPCPWRAIMPADGVHGGPANLLWSGQALPQLRAGAEQARRIVSAWEAGDCLEILGRMDGETLDVEAVIGVCP